MIINLTSIKSKKIRFEHEDVDENWTAAEFRSVANDMPELADRGMVINFLISNGRKIEDDQVLSKLVKGQNGELTIFYTEKAVIIDIEVECHIMTPGIQKKILIIQLTSESSVRDLALAIYKHPEVQADKDQTFAVFSCDAKQLPEARKLILNGDPDIPSQNKKSAITDKNIRALGPIQVAFVKKDVAKLTVQPIGAGNAPINVRVRQSQPGKVTVISIKQAVEKALPGAKVAQQRLIFAGTELQNDEVHESAKLSRTTIFLVTNRPKHITARTLTGREMVYHPPNRNESVYNMREFFAKKMQCDPGLLKFVFNGGPLDNDNALVEDVVPEKCRSKPVFIIRTRPKRQYTGQAMGNSSSSSVSSGYGNQGYGNQAPGSGGGYLPHTPSPHAEKALVGLRNVGNTCYMNAILQCLLQAPPLAKAALDREYKNPVGPAQQFMRFCQLAWKGSYSVMVPSRLKYQVAIKRPQFHGFQQQDCFEFLNVLLEFLEKEPTLGAVVAGAAAAGAADAAIEDAPIVAAPNAAPSKAGGRNPKLDRYHDFPNSESNPQHDLNLRFYNGQQTMLGTPFDDATVDQVLEMGPRPNLFMNNMCLPWLFPLHDCQPKENDECQYLQRHEADIFRKDDTLRNRVLTIFGSLLDCFGMELIYQQGKVSRKLNEFKKGYELLFSPQGLVTMTRALQSLGLLGHEEIKIRFIHHMLSEFQGNDFVDDDSLKPCRQLCQEVWIPSILDEQQRDEMAKAAGCDLDPGASPANSAAASPVQIQKSDEEQPHAAQPSHESKQRDEPQPAAAANAAGAGAAEAEPGKKPPSIVDEFFTGTFQSILRCEVCSSTSSRDESFSSLSLPLPTPSKFIKVCIFRGARHNPPRSVFHTTYHIMVDNGDDITRLNFKLSKCVQRSDAEAGVASSSNHRPWALFAFNDMRNIDTGPVMEFLKGDMPVSKLNLGVVHHAMQLPDSKQLDEDHVQSQADLILRTPFGRGWRATKSPTRADGVHVVRLQSNHGLGATAPVACYLRDDCVSAFSPPAAPASNPAPARTSSHQRVILRFLVKTTSQPIILGINTPVVLHIPRVDSITQLEVYEIVRKTLVFASLKQVPQLILRCSQTGKTKPIQRCLDLLSPLLADMRWTCLDCSFTNSELKNIRVHLPLQNDVQKLPKMKMQQQTLEQCFREFTRTEHLSGSNAVECERCGVKRPQSKTISFSRLPDVLILQLKRFYYHGPNHQSAKLCNLVSFPETGLCLRAQKLPTSSSPDEGAAAPVAPDPATMSNYDLFGVANHMGTLRGGHYTATVKHFTKATWHSFNDSYVSAGTSRQTALAYILFYVRKGVDPAPAIAAAQSAAMSAAAPAEVASASAPHHQDPNF